MLEIVLGDMSYWPAVQVFLPLAADEDDYVKDLWPEWIAHPEKGMTLVALWEHQPVGTTYIAFTDAHTCWLQGIRIDPRFQGKGIGQALSKESVCLAKKMGFKLARCGIDGDNHISQHVTAKAGFEMTSHYRAYLKQQFSPLAKETLGQWLPAEVSDLEGFIELQKKSSLTQDNGGFLFAFNFFAPQVTTGLQEEAVPWDEPHFMKYVIDEKTLAYADVFFGDEEELHGKGYLVQGVIVSDNVSTDQVWDDLEVYLRKQEHQGILVWAHEKDAIVPCLLKKGFELLEGKGFQIWEQKL
jgi:RimJ/RimL family protein N-acetyltransferase